VATVLALLAIALGIAVLFGETAGAAWPGRPGPVVYVAVERGDHRYSYETHGLRVFRPGVPGSEVQLTADPTDSDPQVSPNGRIVVFSRTIGSGSCCPIDGLFVVGIDGSGLRQVTSGGQDGSDLDPAFYPSGGSLVFTRLGGSDDPEHHGNLYSIHLDGSNLRQLTFGEGLELAPTVSPAGRQIAFECGPPLQSYIEDICSIRPDGTHRRVLTRRLDSNGEPFDPDFSPSGHLIAFSVGPGTAADVFTMRADGSRLGALTNRSPNGRRTFPRKVGYALPSFSPAGGSLVAVARPGTGPHLVRIKLRDPKHPQPIGEGLLGSSPIWAAG
jgi:Tol biopolymer transport system component